MQTYTGSCHCGDVAYSVEADINQALSCNCSHCARKGFLLSFVSKAQFSLTHGEDSLTEYRFNKKHIAHLFCKTCGVQCFGYSTDPQGNEMVSINLRTVDNIDLDTLTIQKFDGKSY